MKPDDDAVSEKNPVTEAPVVTPQDPQTADALTQEREKTLGEAAQLNNADYESKRKDLAKQLGWRASELDRERDRRRQRHGDDAPDGLTQLEPWSDPVDGETLLNDVFNAFIDYIIMPEDACVAAALWIIHAHAHDAASHSPMLGFSGPTKRIGKTTALRLTRLLVPKPLPAGNVTAASVFRAVEVWHPTLLIDEADAFLHDKGELRSVLDSGHERQFAFTLRCVGDDYRPTKFSTWCPKVIAFIGRLHPTLEDRMIKLELRRKAPGESVKRIPFDPEPFKQLQRRCARWAQDNIEALRIAEPKMPKELNDRAADNWRPLFAIAGLAGGDWPNLVMKAAIKISAVDDDETQGIQLLEDLRRMFDEEAADDGKNLASTTIVERLGRMEDRPWSEHKNGKPITAHGVARLLKPFKIRPKSVRNDLRVSSGYTPEQFADAWKRYLPRPEPNSG